MNELVEVASLTKSYREAGRIVCVLKDISFSVMPNDYLAIVGPSGAGKSTLLHILGGLEHPTQGRVMFKKQNIYKMKDKDVALWRNKTIGFVFQFYHLIEELNVLENVALASFLKTRKSALKNARILLKYLGIEERGNFFPSQLSGGEKQKVAIARALVNDSEVILCDEPTGNLDKDSQVRVIELLEKLHREKNKTIVLVTHNLQLARRAKRTLFLEAGDIK